nr:hypothetical protein [Nocardia crassostreae]
MAVAIQIGRGQEGCGRFLGEAGAGAQQGLEFVDLDEVVLIGVEGVEGGVRIRNLRIPAEAGGVEFRAGDEEIAIGVGGCNESVDVVDIYVEAQCGDSGENVVGGDEPVAVLVLEVEGVGCLVAGHGYSSKAEFLWLRLQDNG